MVLEMLFFTVSKANIWFAEQKLVWGTYTAVEALPTIKKVEMIEKRKFALVVLNADNNTFVVYVAALVEPTTLSIYLSH